jgi:mRNA-degrading endonuclease toxin of MazEF toxin-antitoxin module
MPPELKDLLQKNDLFQKPERGAIYRIDPGPSKGHEIKGTHYFVILNKHKGQFKSLWICVPLIPYKPEIHGRMPAFYNPFPEDYQGLKGIRVPDPFMVSTFDEARIPQTPLCVLKEEEVNAIADRITKVIGAI